MKKIYNTLRRIYTGIFKYPHMILENTDYDEYWEKRVKDGSSTQQGMINAFQKERTDWIIPRIIENSSVMDISCGMGGILLYLMEHKKINPVATEISDSVIEFLKKKNINAFKCDLNDINQVKKLPVSDYIILFEIIEHLVNPEETVKLMTEKATRSVFISIPNTGYFTHRLRMLFGRSVMQWVVHPGEHLRFWTYKDIKWWLKELGYSERSDIHIYQGIPVLNKLWKTMFGKGMVIEIKVNKQYNL